MDLRKLGALQIRTSKPHLVEILCNQKDGRQ